MDEHLVVKPEQIQHLFEALQKRGYQVVGPTIHDGVIAYDELDAVDDLPVGWTDAQEGGRYQL